MNEMKWMNENVSLQTQHSLTLWDWLGRDKIGLYEQKKKIIFKVLLKEREFPFELLEGL